MATESTRRPPTRPIRPTHVSSPFSNTPTTPTAPNGSTRTEQPGSSRPRGRKGGRKGGVSSSFMNPKPHYQNPYDQITETFNEPQVTNDDDDDNNENGFINSDAYDDIPVEISGSNIPKAVVNTFSELDLAEGLSDNIVNRCKFVKPTPVQKHALPIALAGRDLMACAQTGSGKTAAFCFPIISGILKVRNNGPFAFSGRGSGRTRMACPCALILSPTRELSCQTHEEAQKFAYNTGVKIAIAYGGAPISNQLRNMDKGVDILVATPGRLVDMIERGRVSLRMVKYLALDEADRMLDMGFEPQIRRIVQQMDMPKPGERQTMLFSATFPVEIQRLASDFLSDYIFLTVGRVGSSTDLIAQRVELVQDTDKRSRLMVLLRDQKANGTQGKHRLTLVFVETKKGADALEHWLSRKGFSAIAIHGDKVQMERERALKSFKSGAKPILVATDVASRGLDIPHVSHVINFDLPKDIDGYVHRIGRTGRAGKSGTATAFFSDKNMPLAKALAELMKEANQEVPLWLNQYAENSSNWVGGGGSSKRYGRSKYGGYDFRSDAKSYSDNNYYPGADSLVDSYASSGAYGDVSAGSTYNSASAAYDVSFNNYTAPAAGDANYGFSTGSGSYDDVVASGWD